MAKKDKLRKYSEIRQFENVYSSKNHYEPMVDHCQKGTFEIRGHWHEHFENNGPIILELACGKGHYTNELSKMHPDKNFIGVDVKGNRIWVGAKEALERGATNVAFLRASIELLDLYFFENEVAEIWITFPDPQLKKARKRLTSKRFLDLYRHILTVPHCIHLKTDSDELYVYTKEIIKEEALMTQCDIDDIYALEQIPETLSIQTFYEKMHLKNNKKIKYLSFQFE